MPVADLVHEEASVALEVPPEQEGELTLHDAQSDEALVPCGSGGSLSNGGEYGVMGREFGVLGGRPKKKRGNEDQGGGQIVPVVRDIVRARRPKKDETFSVQARLGFCRAYDGMIESGKAPDYCLGYLSREMGRGIKALRRTLARRAKLEANAKAMGYGITGLVKSEAHLPRYLRKRRQGKHEMKRLSGGGRKSTLMFLYAPVKIFFDEMRAAGQYVDKEDLVEEFEICCKIFTSKMKIKGEALQLTSLEQLRLDEATRKLTKLSKQSVRKYWGDTLQRCSL